MRQRLDQEMVSRGLVTSRARARDLIRRGFVHIAGVKATKPAQSVLPEAAIKIEGEGQNYVSRGALKLAAAIKEFAFDLEDRICVDVGASTGGFTQVLLEAGAGKVYAVDVGHDQFADALRSDPRVVVIERTDARKLTQAEIPDSVEAIVSDVSFISLAKALPAVMALATPDCVLVALIKPQFEVGPERVGKGGIVRDEAAIQNACQDVQSWLEKQIGWTVLGVVPSPITGGSGNREFLIGARFDG
ncbi:MAG: TlyA family RNA methyltransferase [Hyphomicrobiaceae bacterium]